MSPSTDRDESPLVHTKEFPPAAGTGPSLDFVATIQWIGKLYLVMTGITIAFALFVHLTKWTNPCGDILFAIAYMTCIFGIPAACATGLHLFELLQQPRRSKDDHDPDGYFN